jgi:CheY-like chemotaxis protein
MATGEEIRDPEFMAKAFNELLTEGQEFPIKVEGTKTLPYSSVVKAVDPGQKTLLLKLFRPLPPALAMGAVFDLGFATASTRFEGRIKLLGREGYLQYSFQWPAWLRSSDRRLWKRYLFRPRENVYVTAQDSEIPCHGFTGPLTNLSLGGFCFRVDRMVNLEDGLPLRPWASEFDKGRILTMVRIHGLARDEVMEARGRTVRVQEGDSEIHLAVQFQELALAERSFLVRVLEAREAGAGKGGVAGPGRAASAAAFGHGGGGEAEPGADEAPEPEEEAAGLDHLRQLDRRSARILLVSRDVADQASVVQRLRAAGYWRLEAKSDLLAALDLVGQGGPAPVRLLLVDLEADRRAGLEAVGAVRQLESLLRPFGDLPVAFVTRHPDPMLELLDRPGVGTLAREDPDPARPAAVLDRLLKL